MSWTVFLSGEIHTDWRDRFIRTVEAHPLPARFTSPVTDHDASDAAG